MKNNLLLASVIFGLASSASHAFDGDLDASFNTTGARVYAVDLESGGADQMDHALPLPDGSIMLVGTAEIAGNHKLVVAKLQENGQTDTGYGTSGETMVDINVDRNLLEPIGAALQADNKLVVAATIRRTVAPFDQNVAVVRLNTDGSMDTTFNNDGLIPIDIDSSRDDRAHAVAVDSQGRIVVAGAHFDAGGLMDMMSLRLSSSGFLDPDYGGGIRTADIFASSPSWATAVAISSDDEVFVGGCTFTATGDEDFAFWKLTTLGHDDTTFSGDGKLSFWFDVNGFNDDCLESIAVRPEGGVIGVGSAQDGTGDTLIAATLIDSEGSAVTSFGNQSPDNGRYLLAASALTAHGDSANAVAIQPDGMFIMALTVETTNGLDVGALRITPEGNTDTTFGLLGLAVYSQNFGGDNEGASSIALDAQNRPVIGGSALFNGATLDFDYLAMRLENNNDTILKSTFGGQLQ